MKHFIVGLTIFFCNGCRTVETARIEAPTSGLRTTVTLELFGKQRRVDVIYPRGIQLQDVELRFVETEGKLGAGVDRNSAFVVQAMESVSINGEAVIRIYLQRNHFILPTYQQPRSQSFDAKNVFRGMGRVLKSGIQGSDSVYANGGICNGVLVKEDHVLTASHCISTQLECDGAGFIIWDGANYADYACKSVVLTKRGSDQTLIALKERVHKIFQPVSVETAEWYFPNDLPLFVGSDASIWERTRGLLGSILQLQKDTGKKKLTPCKVLGSYYSLNSSYGSELEQALPPTERRGDAKRTTNYALSCEVEPGQSGSGVYGLSGNLVGVVVALDSRFTPLDPEIAGLLR